jgi:ABC-type multidrug transport system ATPase subunit
MRAMGQTCNPQGLLEPKICANGYYCPNGKDEIKCPAGTFCPSGSRAPFNCTYGSLCPEESVNQIVLAPLWVTLVLDVVLGIMVAFGFGISRWRKSRPKKYTTPTGPEPRRSDVYEGAGLLGSPVRSATNSPRMSLTTPGNVSPASSATLTPQLPHTAHMRRSNGRVDNMDGYVDDDQVSTFDDDEIEADFQNNPDFQRFIRSVSRSVTTQSIGLSFDFENLAYETKRGKKILQEVTGTMPRGSMWGVMGGSGAGKSTFLNVLMGKASHTGGAVKINGWPKDMNKYKKLIGYVPQDDIVFPELTVRENILHSARCRLPASWRDKEIQDHVDSLLACLQLTHVKHMRVGDPVKPVISGGQRKRVNIGIELAAAPMAIFLDEPTSGLDATSASSIMRLLKAVSKLGVTVIAIVHQPREKIFYEFDQLLLLASGRSVYSGATEGVHSYFESMGYVFPQRANPADTLMDIITGDGAQYAGSTAKHDTGVQFLIDEWKRTGQYMVHTQHLSIPGLENQSTFKTRSSRRISNQSLNSTTEQENELHRTMKARGATWPAQVYYCWKRAMTQQVRNATSFFFEIGVGGLAGLIIGLSAYAAKGHLFQGLYHPPFTMLSSAVDYKGTPQLGLLGGMAIGLAASAPGFWVFGEEKLIYWRETASGHSRSAYYVGKLLSTLPRIALSSLHFTIFLSILATPLISFTEMYAANLMYFWCIYGLASCIAMVVKRENGPLLAVLASLIIGVLGGVAPPLSTVKEWHMEWFWRLSPGVWFTEAYFSQNIMPLSYLYDVDLAAKTVGFTLDQYSLDVG